MVISVDSEDKFEGAYALWKIFEAAQTPATFFVVAHQLANDERILDINPKLFEAGSHSMRHEIFTKRATDMQFNDMQESRLFLEEKFKTPILGFHPPEERYDEHSINAARQSGYSYFVGDQRLFRMAPVYLDDHFMYFPRVFKDDVIIRKNPGLLSNQDILSVMNEDLSEAKFLGGMYYFNGHSQIMGQGFYLDVMESFLNENRDPRVWKTNFRDLMEWWKLKNQVQIMLEGKNAVLTNKGPERIDNFTVFVGGKPVMVTLRPGESHNLKLE